MATDNTLLTIPGVWSPTTTAEYARCPYRAKLLRDRWALPGDDDRPYQTMGNSLNDLLTAWYRGEPQPAVGWQAEGAYSGKRMREVVEWAYDKCRDTFPRDTMTVVSVDEDLNPDPMSAQRWGRPDLVYAQQGLHVVDWKLRRKQPLDMSRFDHDWQLWHYAAFAQSLWAHEWGDVVDYSMAFIIVEPTLRMVTHTVPVTQERLLQWQEQAIQLWWRMGSGAAWSQQWTGCNLPYYPCEFADHCHRGAQLEQFYVKQERL